MPAKGTKKSWIAYIRQRNGGIRLQSTRVYCTANAAKKAFITQPAGWWPNVTWRGNDGRAANGDRCFVRQIQQ